MWLPELALESSLGPVNVADLNVLYVFPEARRETDDAEIFRRSHAEMRELGVHVGGVSAHPVERQLEVAELHNLPFPLIADPDLQLAAALGLPMVEAGGTRLYERLTIVAWSGRIEKVFYPVDRPEENAKEVLTWLDS